MIHFESHCTSAQFNLCALLVEYSTEDLEKSVVFHPSNNYTPVLLLKEYTNKKNRLAKLQISGWCYVLDLNVQSSSCNSDEAQ